MKTIISSILLFISSLLMAQPDTNPILVNVRDNAKLQWNDSSVKMKLRVIEIRYVTDGKKDFYFKGYLEMYENNAGSYGEKITYLVSSDSTLTNEEKADLIFRYGDKEIEYSTRDKWTDLSGNLVPAGTDGAIPELEYWQKFKLNSGALGMTSQSTQGALDAIYKITIAIVNRMNTRKNF